MNGLHAIDFENGKGRKKEIKDGRRKKIKAEREHEVCIMR